MASALRIARSDLIFLLTISLTACGGDSAGPDNSGNDPLPPRPANAVDVGDNFFDPGSLSVSAGITVMWRWIERADSYTGVGPNSHTVTFSDGIGNSGAQSDGTHTRQFNDTGSYDYFCTIHGAAVMSGTVVVQ